MKTTTVRLHLDTRPAKSDKGQIGKDKQRIDQRIRSQFKSMVAFAGGLFAVQRSRRLAASGDIDVWSEAYDAWWKRREAALIGETGISPSAALEGGRRARESIKGFAEFMPASGKLPATIREEYLRNRDRFQKEEKGRILLGANEHLTVDQDKLITRTIKGYSDLIEKSVEYVKSEFTK